MCLQIDFKYQIVFWSIQLMLNQPKQLNIFRHLLYSNIIVNTTRCYTVSIYGSLQLATENFFEEQEKAALVL